MRIRDGIGQVICSAALLICCACGGSGGKSLHERTGTLGPDPGIGTPPVVVDARGFIDLPLPGELIEVQPARGASYTSEDLHMEAENYSPGLPGNNQTAYSHSLSFEPDWQPGDPVTGLAYATYAFDIQGYDLNNELRFKWNVPPESGELWIALANWDLNRWNWFRAQADSLSVSTPDLDPFISFGGDLLAVVLLTGNQQCELDWLRVGSERPVAVLEVSGPRSGWGSLDTSFDASGSHDPDGSIVKYDWDWDGDGSFDNTTGVNPLVEYSFSEAGTHNVTVRVRDNSGVEATAAASVSVNTAWSHTYGTAGYDHFTGVAAAPDGSLWAAGHIYDFSGSGPTNECLLVHFGADGELLEEIFWAGAITDSSQYYLGIAIDASDGRIYLSGHFLNAGTMRNMLQRRGPLGELEYSKLLPGDPLIFKRFRMSGDRLLLAVNRIDFQSTFQAYVYEISKEGTIQAEYSSAADVIANDVNYRSSVSVLNPPEILICGERIIRDFLDPMIFQSDALYYSIPLDGSESSGRRFGGSSTNESATSISLVTKLAGQSQPLVMLQAPGAGGSSYACLSSPFAETLTGFQFGSSLQSGRLSSRSGGFFGSANDSAPMLLSFNSDLNIEAALRLSGITAIVNDLATGPSSSAALCGTTLDSNGGSFVDAGEAVTAVLPGGWTDISGLFFGGAGQEMTNMPLENFSARSAGNAVIDSGGGEQDAWIHIFQP